MPSSAANIVMALALLAAAAAVCSAADSADVAQMILTGYYDSECLNPLPQTSHPNPQKCSLGECCSRSDGTTSIKLVSCGLHVNAVVYSDEKCESPIVKKTQQNGQIKLDLRKCSPTSGIFFAPGSFYKVECVVPVKYQVEFNVIISIVFVAIFAFIICMSGREYLDMRRGIVPKIVFD